MQTSTTTRNRQALLQVKKKNKKMMATKSELCVMYTGPQ